MILELKEISKSFSDKKVLDRVSFRAVSGSAFGLLGRNGAGKTTMIRILMNVFHQDSGEVLLNGSKIDYRKATFGYLPEERGLYPKKKIIDQLSYFAQLKGMSASESIRAIDVWLERLSMSQYRNKKLETLSKGNQQKIQLITALAHNPDIIILDEPFSGLDPVNAILLKDVVKEEIQKGKIVVFSSHQMNYIEEFCDCIAILKEGRIVLQGDLREIKREYPRDRILARGRKLEEAAVRLGEKSVITNDGELVIFLKNENDKKRIMHQLTEGYEIDEIKVIEPSLNDIFVEYTGDMPRGESGGAI